MPMRNMSKTDSGCGASCAATSPETIAAGVGRDGSYVVTDAPRATGRRSMGTIVQQPPGALPVVARLISGVAAGPPDLRPPRGLPARSPSAPRASLGASARSPARPRRPRDGLQSGGAWCACACPGPAAREARHPHFVRRRASKPARALRTLRRPPHRRRLWFWCECPGPAGRVAASNRAGPGACVLAMALPPHSAWGYAESVGASG